MVIYLYLNIHLKVQLIYFLGDIFLNQYLQLFEVFPEYFLRLIYNTNQGISYLRILAPICILQYIQAPLASSLQAMGKAKDAMMSSVIGVIIRTTLLMIGCNIKIGMWGLVIATSINIIFVTIHQIKKVRKYVF